MPALGDVSAGLAWCVALAGGLWLVACVRAGRRALLPAAAPLLAAVFLWPLYVLAAGSLRSVLGRALAGAAGPVAIALWAAVPLAGGLTGSADAASVGQSLLAGAGAPLLVQSASWALAAAVLPFVLASARRGVLARRLACRPAGRADRTPRTGGRSTRAGGSLGRGHLGRGYTAGAGRACAR